MTNDKIFTATEVGTLVENFDRKLSLIVELVAPLPERLSAVEGRLMVVETEVRSFKDIFRIALPTINNRLTRLEKKVGI